jgi:hypothetical protein
MAPLLDAEEYTRRWQHGDLERVERHGANGLSRFMWRWSKARVHARDLAAPALGHLPTIRIACPNRAGRVAYAAHRDQLCRALDMAP